jgi:hypothetical protein
VVALDQRGGNADKGIKSSGYLRHLRNPRLKTLVGSLACPPEAGCGRKPRWD